jgi:hypothetical protein
LDFRAYGTPPDSYVVRFNGRGVSRAGEQSPPQFQEVHEVHVRLGASYPRVMPELQWRTPIYHPNISAAGVVCLGGYGAHWVPSLNLDELCEMLWEMIRYKNFDVSSPYNRDAAAWAASQRSFRFPVDDRPIRDRKASGSLAERQAPIVADEVIFLSDDDIICAEIVEGDDSDILIIE